MHKNTTFVSFPAFRGLTSHIPILHLLRFFFENNAIRRREIEATSRFVKRPTTKSVTTAICVSLAFSKRTAKQILWEKKHKVLICALFVSIRQRKSHC